MSRADWITQASCRDYEVTGDDDPWYADAKTATSLAQQRIAIAICMTCPVRQQCLDDALTDDSGHGIRGGLTAPQRAQLQAGRQAASRLAPCGTRSAYKRHIRNKEPIDDACRAAEAAYREQRKQALA